MTNGPSKAQGNTDSTVGSIKESVGSTLGNHSLEGKGSAQKTKSDAEVQTVKSQGYAEGTKDELMGSVKDAFGSLTGNEKMQAEGKASKLQGDAKKQFNT